MENETSKALNNMGIEPILVGNMDNSVWKKIYKATHDIIGVPDCKIEAVVECNNEDFRLRKTAIMTFNESFLNGKEFGKALQFLALKFPPQYIDETKIIMLSERYFYAIDSEWRTKFNKRLGQELYCGVKFLIK